MKKSIIFPMPELPEVETIRRDLNRKIRRHPIAAVEIVDPRAVRSEPSSFARQLVGARITKLGRCGKLLIFSLNSDRHLLIHLKMTGQLIYTRGNDVIAGGHSFTKLRHDWLFRYVRAVITFADHAKLHFNDARTFGYIKVVDSETLETILSRYGIEPLTPEFTPAAFAALLRDRKTSIKAVLLNQALLSGIGNIYADEICFRARVHPARPAGALNPAEVKRLFRACVYILEFAIQKRGTTFNHFVDGNGNRGGFLAYLNVYGRAGEPCPSRCGRLIQKIKIAGRGTHFCPHCQPAGRT